MPYELLTVVNMCESLGRPFSSMPLICALHVLKHAKQKGISQQVEL